ncbi:type II toxin-antitoxin system RelE/ParE family toxin [Rhizobium tumorigenes]|uniref:Type II toxin-antitoxin system RelE/ParE family toxin n=1 Tax=Rhizobium tumorigenes TaxID=2041385 RepID=A0AAF1KJ36_9HYPH|nr:type II toxin-antitoxin system RelE/ParE family toxin [Rhizobium tumorigenes]WFR96060.1 type II toxin-antitoxin system RelE/ParE family toxin [Rhizobium tumorigenes]
MKLRVVYRPLAEDDLVAIYSFFADKSPLSAIALIRRIRAQCATLETMAERGPLRESLGLGVRIFVIDRMVTVAYRIEAGRVQIMRVFYAGQNIPENVVDD